MLPLFFRPAAAGPLHGPFVSRRLGAASFLLVVLCAALAFPVTASAHTATTSAHMVQASTGTHTMKSTPCLSVTFWERYTTPNPGVTAFFNFDMTNKCGFPVRNIVARYNLVSLCDSKGSGNRAANFAVPDLAAGGSMGAPLMFTSYCISCTNGVMSFPKFSIDVSIIAAAGFHAKNASQVATLHPGARHEDSAVLLNGTNNPGPLSCDHPE